MDTSPKMSNLNAWILASRPKTLTVAIAPIIVASALAWEDGGFHLGAVLIAALCAILITIGTNLCNDYADFIRGADTDERKGPKRVTQAGLIQPRKVMIASSTVFAVAAFFGMYLFFRAGWEVLVIGFASILSGIFYTAGPWPYGYKGLGELFVLIFFGPVAVAGTYYVQMLEVTSTVVIVGLAPGLWGIAILTVNNIRDIHEDRKAKKMTLVVRFGRNFGIALWAGCIIIAALIPPSIGYALGDHLWADLPSLTLIPSVAILYWLITRREPEGLNPLLGYTAMLSLMYSVLFGVGWVI